MKQAIAALFLLALPAAAQDQAKIDEAIKKGIEFLKTQGSPGYESHAPNCDELILLTFVHAGVPDTDPKFRELFKSMMEAKLEKTYKVSLQAMVLEEYERVKYQWRIKQCAQHLVDNQSKNGQWSYGEETPFADEGIPTGAMKKDVATTKKEVRELVPSHMKAKPKVVNRVPVQKRKFGPDTGDNSNSQYAALGLRACHDAGIILPKVTVITPARKWWTESQHPDPSGQDNGYGGVRGWNYTTSAAHGPYYSMSAGAVGAACILDYILGQDWKKDKTVLGGMGWLGKNMSFTENANCETDGRPNSFLYYTLYAVERAGMLYDTATIGTIDWYFEGCRAILPAQKPDGSWAASSYGSKETEPVWDTCFAILFLKKATRRLVATDSAASKRD